MIKVLPRSDLPSLRVQPLNRVLEKLNRWSYLSIMSDQLRLSTRNQTGWRFWTQRILVKLHHHHKKYARRKQARRSHYKPVLMSCIPTGHDFRVLIKELLKKTSPANLCVFAYLKPFLVHMSLDRLRTGEQPLWAEVTVGTQLGGCSLPKMTCHLRPLSSAKVWCAICIYIYMCAYIHICIYHSFIYINMCEYMYIYYWLYDDIHDYDVYICMPWSTNGKWLVVIPPSLGIPHNRYVDVLVLINLGWWPRNLWIDWWGI